MEDVIQMVDRYLTALEVADRCGNDPNDSARCLMVRAFDRWWTHLVQVSAPWEGAAGPQFDPAAPGPAVGRRAAFLLLVATVRGSNVVGQWTRLLSDGVLGPNPEYWVEVGAVPQVAGILDRIVAEGDAIFAETLEIIERRGQECDPNLAGKTARNSRKADQS